MDEIAQNVDRIAVLSDAHVLMSGTPREVFARADELVAAGLDVPQVTRVAMALRARAAHRPRGLHGRGAEGGVACAAKGGEPYAEGHHPRPVFPRRHARPPARPAHQAAGDRSLYHSHLSGKGPHCLRRADPDADRLRAHLEGGREGALPRPQDGAVHHRLHRGAEPLLHPPAPSSRSSGSSTSRARV